MSVNVYAREAKLHSARGRLDYLTNPDRQENLLAIAGMVDADYWQQLSADAQLAWRRAGGDREKGVCCEAREIHGDLPNSALEGDLKTLAKKMVADFRARTGADCVVAIHLNKARNNLHYHLMWSERKRLPEPEVKLADRATYLDEQGVRRRTKKEILDVDGQVRPSCRIIPKGDVLDVRYFGEKEPIFKEKGWLYGYKQHIAAWINRELEPDERRTVFDHSGPYLPQEHVGKGRPAKQADAIREYNEEVRRYNAAVRDGTIPEESAHQIKLQVMLSPNRLQALRAALTMEENNNVKMTEELQGGVRTASSQNEQKKRELRELYRKAAAARRDAEQASGIERTILLADARQYSGRIERLRRELGYYKDADYERRLRQIWEELQRKQAWLMRCRSRVASLERWVYSLEGRVKYLKRKYYEMPLFILTKEQEAEKKQLKADLKAAREKLLDARVQEFNASLQYRLEKMQAKQEHKKLKEERRQLKKERKQLER